MKKAELVFLPLPEIGHLVSMVELARRLINQDDRLSITFINTAAPFGSTTTGEIESLGNSLANSDSRIRFINLPHQVIIHDQPAPSQNLSAESSLALFIENQKPHLIQAITRHSDNKQSNFNSPQLAGFVVDLFWVSMIDVADQLDIPTYVYFTSGAATLGVFLHLPTLHDEAARTGLKNHKGELSIPSFFNPVPPSVLPTVFLDNTTEAYACFLNCSTRLKETAGIIVNTFADLESHAMDSFHDGQTPPVYPVGPLLNLKGRLGSAHEADKDEKIMKWLDHQPPSSVIFLCFGSRGSFSEVQVKEMAVGLEKSGHRFLWSLRRPTSAAGSTSDITNLEQVLPDGFLGRIEGRGLICGWVPQTAILAHKSVGGFISHCGWNSILESLWYGVPIVPWPLYAEQKLNAFELVWEFGLGFDMGLTLRMRTDDEGGVVTAKEVERGVRLIMDADHEGKEVMRMKEMRDKSKMTLLDSGASINFLKKLIKDITDRI